MRITGFDIHPLTPDRWDDFEIVLGKGGISGCWCMYWLAATSAAWGKGQTGGAKAANKSAFAGIVDAGPPPGLLAYDGATPVAWARVMPRAAHPGLANSRYFKTDLDIEGVWSISCFVVRAKWRGRGLTAVLIRAAADWARANGARMLEAYPTDTTARKYPSSVYTGLASTFRRMGFREVQRKADHKPMMRLDL